MASSRHYVPPPTRRASSEASIWAAKRRAAIERSEVLKAERRRQEEELVRLQAEVHVPVKESGPVEPNGYTPWWEQHEGVGAERLPSQQSRTAKVEEEAPRPERARRRQWGKSPQDNGAPVADRLYAGGSTFSEGGGQSPEKHPVEHEEEQTGGDSKWCLRSFLDNPFRKGDKPEWQDTDANVHPGAEAGFGIPKTVPGGKGADAGIRSLETATAASRSRPRMPHQVPRDPQRPPETRPSMKLPGQGENGRKIAGDTGTTSRSDASETPKKPAEEEFPVVYSTWVPDWASSEEKSPEQEPDERRANVSERSMAYSPSNYESPNSQAAVADEARVGARATGAHRPAAAARAAPRPWQAMAEPPTATLPDRSKAELDPTALQPRRPKAAPAVPEVSSASATMECSAPAPRKAASARPARPSGAAKRDDWLAAQGGNSASQARHGDASKTSKEDEVTRQMVDKRQSRKDNQESFAAVIHQFRQRVAEHGRVPAQLHVEGQTMANVDTGIDVFVRKRPQFKHEVQRGEYDIVTVPFENQVVVHNCQMYPDLKRMLIKHQGFPATCAFGHQVDNIAVYERAAAPLIHWAAQGGVAALFMYGQTGSGKTFTMSSIEELGVLQLFEHTVAASKREGTPVRVRVAFFEITGKKCFDLLHHKRREIFLKDSEDGYVILQGAEEPYVESADELLAIVDEAKGRRSTHATDVNASSSRSHAVLRITVERTRSEHGVPYSVSQLGRLTLVDCAGSERKEDSMYHDAERRKEAAEINASLYALRECVRFRRMERQAAAAGGPTPHVHVPYRSSQLTRVLMECFVKDDARMAVIATVSPNPTDTEHIVSTLRTACMISGSDAGCRELKENVPMTALMRREQERQVAPIHWSHADVKNWLRRVCKGAVANAAERLSRTIDGRALVRMNELMLRNTLSGGDPELAAQIYDALRQEIARVDQFMAKRRQEARDTAARAKSGNY